jgi:hypothetical protein
MQSIRPAVFVLALVAGLERLRRQRWCGGGRILSERTNGTLKDLDFRRIAKLFVPRLPPMQSVVQNHVQ